MQVRIDAHGVHVCEHGVALDVHCCGRGGDPYPGCHSGFIFDVDACDCTLGDREDPIVNDTRCADCFDEFWNGEAFAVWEHGDCKLVCGACAGWYRHPVFYEVPPLARILKPGTPIRLTTPQ